MGTGSSVESIDIHIHVHVDNSDNWVWDPKPQDKKVVDSEQGLATCIAAIVYPLL